MSPGVGHGLGEADVEAAPDDPCGEAGPGLHHVAARTHGHHACTGWSQAGAHAGEVLTCQTPIDQLDQAPVAALEDLDDEEDGEAAADASEERVDDGEGHGGAVLGLRDLGLGAAVEREEAEDEDEGAEADEGDRVARQRVVLKRGVDTKYCV